MIPNIYVYLANLPSGVNEFITETPEGDYTIYLSASNTQEQWEKSYKHALKHIEQYDFEKRNVQEIEYSSHYKP